MKLQTEIISKEILKPSSPTPDHLHHYNLSFLDQLSPPVYNPLLLFYQTDGVHKVNNVENYILLKKSLSQALIHFYPLSGRIQDNNFVHCNDEGIPCVLVKATGKVSDVLENPMPDEIKKLLPFKLDEEDHEIPLGVQFNNFDCGGICIGLCLSHKIADGLSTLVFVKIWAAISRGEGEEIVMPEFVSAKLFSPKNLSGFNPRIGIVKENVVAKRFLFKPSVIDSLRGKYAASISLKNQRPPSRIEALSTFIWSRFIAATEQEYSEKTYMMVQAVNLRTRMCPPLQEYSFGNYYRFAITIPSNTNDGEGNNYDNSNIITQMRDSISKIDKNYVKKLQEAGNDEHMDFVKRMSEFFMSGQMVTLNFTSLCRFPLYEADFGWGKPIWVGSPSLSFKNLVIFMDTASGDGIEALVHLNEEDMHKFNEDQELLQLISS